MIKLTNHHETILRIWFVDNIDAHYTLERLYWHLEPNLSLINSIAVDSSKPKISIIILADDLKSIKSRCDSFSLDGDYSITVLKPSDAFRRINQLKDPLSALDRLDIIYDPKGQLTTSIQNKLESH